jgi:hypothetical protein
MRASRSALLTVVAVCSVAACSASAAEPASSAATRQLLAPLTRADPARLFPGEAAAIVALGSTGAGPPADHSGHSHGATTVEVPLFTGDAATFADQWLTAQAAIPTFDSIEKATQLGYVRATAWVAGIGVHWVLWSQIGKPFDPARPAMLLFDERRQPAPLVGFSYALQSPTQPVGFAGDNDHWHQHSGLCVDASGWVVREQATPDTCPGTYIAGGDFWMLHAWVVPGWENRDGRFASFNPKLCPPDVGTPDIARCPA